MKVLMLGWEFPPFISGGLGVACHGLTRALSRAGAEILFVLPRAVPASHSGHVQLLGPDTPDQGTDLDAQLGEQRVAPELERLRLFPVASPLTPYARPAGPSGSGEAAEPAVTRPAGAVADDYGGDLFAEVQRYTRLVCRLARGRQFDLIHAHDWMTYPAGICVAAMTGKPLVVHAHSTEFDRSGEQVNPYIYRIERAGYHRAQAVVAVSYLTRGVVADRYGVSLDKVHVVHNAIETNGRLARPTFRPLLQEEKVVLFLGRMTMQKGPQYFVSAAQQVLRRRDDVRFIMAGSGDLLGRTMAQARELGLSDRIVFPGFLRGNDVDRVYRMADVYVMPSVSEPFGLVALEAISHGVPTIVSKQSGVAEVLDHVLKVDYWDVPGIADGIVTVLGEPGLRAALRVNSLRDLAKLSWAESANRCLAVYETLVTS